jgi:hypothetical protein
MLQVCALFASSVLPFGYLPRLISRLTLLAQQARHFQSSNRGGKPVTLRPDPTFHASPKLAMEAPTEN